MASKSSFGLSAEEKRGEEKKEKQRQSVRDSRWRNKQETDKMKAATHSLQQEISHLNSQIAKEQAKNAVWGQVVNTMRQAKPALNNHPAMQRLLKNTTNQQWKTYESPKYWRTPCGLAYGSVDFERRTELKGGAILCRKRSLSRGHQGVSCVNNENKTKKQV